MKKTLLSLLAAVAAVSVAAADTPKGLRDSDWSSIRAAYEAGRHGFQPNADGTWSAWNPGQGWRMTFDRRGFTARPGDKAWTWGLELAGSVEGARSIEAAGQKLTLKHGADVEEWFINDERGLEQGWTLAKSVGPLKLKVRGGLKPMVQPGQVRFGTALTYGGLKAWDANGKTVRTWFEPMAEGFAVHYDDKDAQYPVTIDPLAQNAYVKASNAEALDNFGAAVAVSGDTVVIGAPQEQSNATGVNGDQTNNSASGAGAAYVFVRSGASWVQQAYLKASNTQAFDEFGFDVAVSGDTIVVGARSEDSANPANQADNSAGAAGAAYVFVRSGTTWTQQAYLKPLVIGAGDEFGRVVAISGETIVVGASGEDSNATTVGGNDADNSASGAGAAYVFVRSGTSWTQQAYLKASNSAAGDAFGGYVAVSGDIAVIGASQEDSNATGVNGNPANDSALESGAAYVFIRNGATWTQQAYLKASNTNAADSFGRAVDVDGDTVVVGAFGEDSASGGVGGLQGDNSASSAGAAYVFVTDGTSWTQQAYVKAADPADGDSFGTSVGVSGEVMVVGASSEGSAATGVNGNPFDNGNSLAGAAYVFTRTGTRWVQKAYLKPGSTASSPAFGHSVAVSGDTVVVGAIEEDLSFRGVNPVVPGGGGGDSGAAYIYDVLLSTASKSGTSAPGAADIRFGTPGGAAIGSNNELLWDQSLSGAGSTLGRNRAVFSTLAPGNDATDLASQTGTLFTGVFSLPANAKIATLGQTLAHQAARGLYQATVTGTGVTAANNRLLVKDDGEVLLPLLRTGVAQALLGNAAITGFRQCLQNPSLDSILLGCQLGSSTLALVPATADTGIFYLNHNGNLQANVSAREGQSAYDGGGTFGQFGTLAATGLGDTAGFHCFSATLIPTSGTPVNAIFKSNVSGALQSRVAKVGDAAPGAAGTTFGSFTALSQCRSGPLFKATLKNAPTGSNEGLWLDGSLAVRKGDAVDAVNLPGVVISRIVRFWPVTVTEQLVVPSAAFQVVMQVTLTGPGVTPTNNQALVLLQANAQYLVLLRTGNAAPGVPGGKLSAISAVDVNPVTGHYAVLGTLSGVSAGSNQALWTGRTELGDDGSGKVKRLPKLRLRKGQFYASTATPQGFIRSLALKPPVDATGAGGRGLAQQISTNGAVAIRVTGDGGSVELISLHP